LEPAPATRLRRGLGGAVALEVHDGLGRDAPAGPAAAARGGVECLKLAVLDPPKNFFGIDADLLGVLRRR
jgi:hypothetical protein